MIYTTRKVKQEITVDFGEVKIAATKCKVKCFQMMSSAYLHFSKAPQNVLMFMTNQNKRSAIYIETSR